MKIRAHQLLSPMPVTALDIGLLRYPCNKVALESLVTKSRTHQH